MSAPPRRSTDAFRLAAVAAAVVVGGALLWRARAGRGHAGASPLADRAASLARVCTHRIPAAAAVGTMHLALGAVYYGLLTPIGVIVRQAGDPLLRRTTSAQSYWCERPTSRQSREQYQVPF